MPKFSITYWTSHSMQRGFELGGGQLTLSNRLEQTLSLPTGLILILIIRV